MDALLPVSEGQQTSPLDAVRFESYDNNFIRATSGEEETLYQVIAENGGRLVILNRTSNQQHEIPISATKITLSKNYIFALPKEGSTEFPGFYLIRLIDAHQFGFKSSIPVFFIPIADEIGTVKDLGVESEDDEKIRSEEVKEEESVPLGADEPKINYDEPVGGLIPDDY